MMTPFVFKLIFRSWWRNKLFFSLSVFSLATGLACANMLMVFVLYESDIEADNPEKGNILCMSQPFPMDTTRMVSYIAGGIPQQIKDRYPEIENFVRMQNPKVRSYSIDGNRLTGMTLVSADSSFTGFFPCEPVYGSAGRIFGAPDKLGLSEGFARRIFGDDNPVGRIIRMKIVSERIVERDFEVVAVLKDRDQSLLSFDAVTTNSPSFRGGTTLLLTNRKIDSDEFGERLKKDGIPTLRGGIGKYAFSTLQETYFSAYREESLPYFRYQQPVLLYTEWIAAMLVLLIACINYAYLNLSRLLEQAKLVRTQRIAGASSFQVGAQLFTDTFLMLLVSFGISILLIHDLAPVFNSVVSGRLNTAFFFSARVFPVLVALLVVFSLLVALFVGYRLVRLPVQLSRLQEDAGRKERTVRALSIIQYAISLGLLIATITARQQLDFVKYGGENYKQVFEAGSSESEPGKIRLFAERISGIPEVESVTTSGSSILNSWIRQLVIKDGKGEETYAGLLEFRVSGNFNKTLSLGLLQGMEPEEAKKHYARPVYVNREFIRHLVSGNENPVGKPLVSYDKDFREQKPGGDENEQDVSVIAGIIGDLHTGSFEDRILPQAFHIDNKASSFVQFKLSNAGAQVMEKLEAAWNETNPQTVFTYNDLLRQFMDNNKKLTGLYNLLAMYAVISLTLTMSGLFGTAYYTTVRRTKEIGIRRINGATVFQILLLLNRRFVLWIGIALLIAAPPVWLLLHGWLQNFVYRIGVSPLVFLAAGGIVLGVTLLAVSWQSYMAATRDPVKSLRSE